MGIRMSVLENKMNYPKFKVCVICMTYNHASYIRDALNGFCMQQTDFPFVCCVVDDASTDGEQEVIRKYVEGHFDLTDETVAYQRETDYADITFAQHKTNRNCYFAVLYLKENHYSNPALKGKKNQYLAEWRDMCEYVALCEGDDWWIEPEKIQQQVDFLQIHPSYSLCHTAFRFYDDILGQSYSSNKISRKNLQILEHNEDVVLLIIDSNTYRIQTCSVMYRLAHYNACSALMGKYQSGFLMGDTQLWCYLLSIGAVHFIPRETCVYCLHTGSACHTDSIRQRLRFLLSASELRVQLVNDFGYSGVVKKRFQRRYVKALANYICFDSRYQLIVPINRRIDEVYVKLCRSIILSWIIRFKFNIGYCYLHPILKRVKGMVLRIYSVFKKFER